MVRRSPPVPRKMIWRISESAPMGAWVDPLAPVARAPITELPETLYGSWVTSSFDLLNGTDVVELPDLLSAEVFAEMFPSRQDAVKSPMDLEPKPLDSLTGRRAARRN